jgi:hypothetical protein
MTDLEITKACAAKMGLSEEQQAGFCESPYDPLHDDAQAMALVKKFYLTISRGLDGWSTLGATGWVSNKDLNRAICECVAKIP